MIRIAPWTDYSNQPIHDGDTLQHPSGQTGTVFYQNRGQDTDSWLVSYPDNPNPSRLCLQIGDKGQAVVVK